MKGKNEYTVLPVYPIYVFSNLFHYWRNKVFNCIAQLGMVDNKMYRWCFCFCYHSPLSLMNQYLQIMKSGSCTYPQYVIRIFSGKSLRITHVRPVFLFTVWNIGFTKNPGKIQSRWIFVELSRCQSRDFVFKRFRRKNGYNSFLLRFYVFFYPLFLSVVHAVPDKNPFEKFFAYCV